MLSLLLMKMVTKSKESILFTLKHCTQINLNHSKYKKVYIFVIACRYFIGQHVHRSKITNLRVFKFLKVTMNM